MDLHTCTLVDFKCCNGTASLFAIIYPVNVFFLRPGIWDCQVTRTGTLLSMLVESTSTKGDKGPPLLFLVRNF
jgi:hypothetical protein